ncbi:MAG: hypothetical protein VYE27_07440 [Pseudomonadota bacterium]|nr:hypothetical protein [Pseudomonadota bacterium]
MSNKALTYTLAFSAIVGALIFAIISVFEIRNNIVAKDKSNNLRKLHAEEQSLTEKLTRGKDQLDDLNLAIKTSKEKILEQAEAENKLAESVIDLSEAKLILIDDIKQLQNKKEEKKEVLDTDLEIIPEYKEEKQKLLVKISELEERVIQLSGEKKLELENRESLKAEIVQLKEKESMHNNAEILVLQDSVKKLQLEKLEISSLSQNYITENEVLTENFNKLTLEKDKLEELLASNNAELEKARKLSLEASKIRLRNSKLASDLENIRSSFDKLDGLRVIFSGNMIYDDDRSQIVFQAENSIGIPIFQDDFTGSIAGKCGLPIDEKIENRCSATIIAEFVVEQGRLFLRGEEIVEIVKSKE